MISDEDEGRGWILGVVLGVVALAIALAIGVSLHYKNSKKAGTANASASTTTTAATDSAAGDIASVKVENGVVKFYFASGKADIAVGGKEALAEVVKAVGAGKKAVVSGFHDVTGSDAKNQELSKMRAFAVRDALKALGVPDDKIDLKKPEDTLASGSNAEARRVEVSIQ